MTDDALSLDLFGDADGSGGAEEAPAAGATEGRTEGASGGPDSTEADTPEAPEPEEADTAEAPEPEVWTVSQVNRAVRRLLEKALTSLWVSGEIGGWKRARSGHRYFTLKDDQAQLRCVMWRNDAARLPTDPDEGMEVRVYGSLTLYEARGEYQLVARRLEAAGEEGLWRIAFEKLRRKLEAEGLLARERKRPLPRFPGTVGVVTSATGAAVRDILSVIQRRAPWTRVIVRSSRVQGEGAALEVAEALRALGRSGLADVIIVGRGGGSLEDLWAFNEEPVARAIAGCPVPVVSAVGHEVDVTIADLVADVRAPTPSAGAEAVVQDGAALLEGLRRLPARLTRALQASLRRRTDRLSAARAGLERGMVRMLQPRRLGVDRAAEGLENRMRTLVERRGQRLARSAAKLEALSPLQTLRRGYAVPLGDEGRLLRGVADFEPGAEFALRVADGRIRCETLEIHSGDEVFGE